MDMMIQRLVVVLLVVALVGLVRAEDAEEVVVASAEELNWGEEDHMAER